METMGFVQYSFGSTFGPTAETPFILITIQHFKAKNRDHFQMSI